ncbi:hypothetical protein VTK26DRAFT_3739 [Humicola hyalothermophila]
MTFTLLWLARIIPSNAVTSSVTWSPTWKYFRPRCHLILKLTPVARCSTHQPSSCGHTPICVSRTASTASTVLPARPSRTRGSLLSIILRQLVCALYTLVKTHCGGLIEL